MGGQSYRESAPGHSPDGHATTRSKHQENDARKSQSVVVMRRPREIDGQKCQTMVLWRRPHEIDNQNIKLSNRITWRMTSQILKR